MHFIPQIAQSLGTKPKQGKSLQTLILKSVSVESFKIIRVQYFLGHILIITLQLPYLPEVFGHLMPLFHLKFEQLFKSLSVCLK